MSNKNRVTLNASIKPKDGAQLYVDWSLIDTSENKEIFRGRGLKMTPQLILKSGTYELVVDVKGKKGNKLERTAKAGDMAVYPSKPTSHTLPDLGVTESRDQYTFLVESK